MHGIIAASLLVTGLTVGSGEGGTARAPSAAEASESADSARVRAGWLSMGAAILGDRVYVLGSLNMQHDAQLYTLRAALYDPGDGQKDFGEYGVLIGRAGSKGRVFGSGALGLGVLTQTAYENCGWLSPFECQTDTVGRAVGVLFEANTAVRLASQGPGLGLTVFGNLNSMRHVAGATLSLTLGRWR